MMFGGNHRMFNSQRVVKLSWLGYQDSNLEWLYQKQLCCQLHHTPMTLAFGLPLVGASRLLCEPRRD